MVTLDTDAVRAEVAVLMRYRLHASGFTSGRGGTPLLDFDATTTPTLADADRAVARIVGLVSDDFPEAVEGDTPELVTIAGLRAAIELENAAPNVDRDRIKTWFDLLREYVGRFSDGGSDDGEGAGGRVLSAVWYFGPGCGLHAPGSELPLTYPCRRVW